MKKFHTVSLTLAAVIAAGLVASKYIRTSSSAEHSIITAEESTAKKTPGAIRQDTTSKPQPAEKNSSHLVAADGSDESEKTAEMAYCPVHGVHHFTSSDPLNLGKRPKRSDAQPLLDLRNARVGSKVKFSLAGHEFSGKINLSRDQRDGNEWLVGIELERFDNAVLTLGRNSKGFTGGEILNATGTVAYQLEATHDLSQMVVTRANNNDIVCGTADNVGIAGTNALPANTLPANAASETDNSPVAAASANALSLQSLPGAANVLYLDFDGETVTGTAWNSSSNGGSPIVATASSKNNDTDIERIWSIIAEDFRPFAVNVTTSRSVYDAASSWNRMMVIFTQYSEWYGGAGGVAYLYSFGDTRYKVCWVFTDNLGDYRTVSIAASHEAGHTMGLSHDGGTANPSYYSGHGFGVTSWGPIMGAPYSRSLVTWDNGTYPGANQRQDDLQIIKNMIGTRTDQEPGATPLNLQPDSQVQHEAEFSFGSSNRPEISDIYTFETRGGNFNITVNDYPLDPSPGLTTQRYISNLDLKIELIDSATGNTVFSDLGSGKRNAAISGQLAAGNYELRIATTTASGATGYPTYGQMGIYSITGNIPHAGGLTVTPGAITAEGIQFSADAIREFTISSPLDEVFNYTLSSNANWLTLNNTSGSVTSGSASITATLSPAGLSTGTHRAEITLESPTLTSPIIIPVTFDVFSGTESREPITINDSGPASPYPSTIDVPNIAGSIVNVTVTVEGLSHTYPSDLQFLLVSPSGEKVMLLDSKGGSFDINSGKIIFSTGGASVGSTLRTGTYAPSGPASGTTSLVSPAPQAPYGNSLGVLNGVSPTGTWQLFINDRYARDSGNIEKWSLSFETRDIPLVTQSYDFFSTTNHSLKFSSTPGREYIIEGTSDFVNWKEYSRVSASVEETSVNFNVPMTDRFFFRVRSE